MSRKLILSLFLCGTFPHLAAEDACSSSSYPLSALSGEEKVRKVEQLKAEQLDIETKLNELKTSTTLSSTSKELWGPAFKEETVVPFIAKSFEPLAYNYSADTISMMGQKVPKPYFLYGYTGALRPDNRLSIKADEYSAYFIRGGTESDPTEAVNQFIEEIKPTEKTYVYYIYTSPEWAEHLVNGHVVNREFSEHVICRSFCIYWPFDDENTMEADYIVPALSRFNSKAEGYLLRSFKSLGIRSPKILPQTHS